MPRRTQGIVALGASAVLGVVAGVLVTTTGPDRVVPNNRGSGGGNDDSGDDG